MLCCRRQTYSLNYRIYFLNVVLSTKVRFLTFWLSLKKMASNCLLLVHRDPRSVRLSMHGAACGSNNFIVLIGAKKEEGIVHASGVLACCIIKAVRAAS